MDENRRLRREREERKRRMRFLLLLLIVLLALLIAIVLYSQEGQLSEDQVFDMEYVPAVDEGYLSIYTPDSHSGMLLIFSVPVPERPTLGRVLDIWEHFAGVDLIDKVTYGPEQAVIDLNQEPTNLELMSVEQTFISLESAGLTWYPGDYKPERLVFRLDGEIYSQIDYTGAGESGIYLGQVENGSVSVVYYLLSGLNTNDPQSLLQALMSYSGSFGDSRLFFPKPLEGRSPGLQQVSRTIYLDFGKEWSIVKGTQESLDLFNDLLILTFNQVHIVDSLQISIEGQEPYELKLRNLYPNPAQAKVDYANELTLTAVGDIMLGRGVARVMPEKEPSYPFTYVNDQFEKSHLVFGNLEMVISERGEPLPGKGIWLKGEPEVSGRLKYFDVLNTANNHTVDYDTEGLMDTIEYLLEQGIQPVGAGQDLNRARAPIYLEVEGMMLAILSYSEMADIFFSWDYRRPMGATPDRAGINPYNPEEIKKDISAVKDADWLLLSLHWGEEGLAYPREDQRLDARSFIDAGADIIIGHHPHNLQGIEMYKGRPIFYSLGNFVYDQRKRHQIETILAEITISKDAIEQVRVLPLLIHEGQPKSVNDQDLNIILGRLTEMSRGMNVDISEVGGWGLISQQLHR